MLINEDNSSADASICGGGTEGISCFATAEELYFYNYNSEPLPAGEVARRSRDGEGK